MLRKRSAHDCPTGLVLTIEEWDPSQTQDIQGIVGQCLIPDTLEQLSTRRHRLPASRRASDWPAIIGYRLL